MCRAREEGEFSFCAQNVVVFPLSCSHGVGRTQQARPSSKALYHTMKTLWIDNLYFFDDFLKSPQCHILEDEEREHRGISPKVEILIAVSHSGKGDTQYERVILALKCFLQH